MPEDAKPEDAEARAVQWRFERAEAAVKAGQYEEAIKQFHTLIAAQPGNSRWRSWLAHCLELAGRHHEALAEWQRLLPDPSCREARHRLIKCGLAICEQYQAAGRLEEAVALGEQLMRDFPDKLGELSPKVAVFRIALKQSEGPSVRGYVSPVGPLVVSALAVAASLALFRLNPLIVGALVLCTSCWVLWDAAAVGSRKPGQHILGTAPAAWFIGCLLLWIVFFPYYLVKREQFLRHHRVGHSMWALAGVTVFAAFVVPFGLISFALEQLPTGIAPTRTTVPSLPTSSACTACGGAGATTCTFCNGAGQERCAGCGGVGSIGSGDYEQKCPVCGGAGETVCTLCGGTGKVDCPLCVNGRAP